MVTLLSCRTFNARYHTDDRLGWPKVASAKKALSLLNLMFPSFPYNEFVSEANVNDLVKDHDIVIDGTDNYDARILVLR